MPDYSSHVPHIISKVRHAISDYLQKRLEEAGCQGIVPSHGDILSNLFIHGELTMTQLAINIKRDRSTVTTLVKKLERQGMVALIHNPDDMRSKKVVLTEKGMQFKACFNKISEDLLGTLWEGVLEEDKEVFIKVLLQIRSNFEDPTA